MTDWDIFRSSIYNRKTGLWLRDKIGNTTGDERVIAEQSVYRRLPIIPGDTVLDLGAHIGAFVRLVALSRQPKLIVCVEPDPVSYMLLRINIAGIDNILALESAVVVEDIETVILYRNARAAVMHTIVPTRRREQVIVQAISLAELLERYHPSVIKMDIEGGEHSLLSQLVSLPGFVEAIALEIHPYKGDKTREASRSLVDGLAHAFTPLKAAYITDNNWCTQGVYARGAHLEFAQQHNSDKR